MAPRERTLKCMTRMSTWMKFQTSVAVALVQAADHLDEALLTSLYLPLSRTLGVTPTGLGGLSLARSLVKSLVSPAAGVLGDRCNRMHLIVAGTACWAVFTMLFGFAKHYAEAATWAACTGLGLALVFPASQSLVADMFAPEKRGRAFGTLMTIAALSGMAGSFFSIQMGGMHFGHTAGWRLAYWVVAGVGALACAMAWVAIVEPRSLLRKPAPPAGGPPPRRAWLAVARAETLRVLRDFWTVLKIPTFVVMMAEHVVGTISWSSGYRTMYFQLLGFSNTATSIMVQFTTAGAAVGFLIGGYIGDLAAKRFPNVARPAIIQLSLVLAAPLSIIMYTPAMPGSSSHANGRSGSLDHLAYVYAALMFFSGLVHTWAWPNNIAIMSEIVPTTLRSSVFALDRCIAGVLGAALAPLVGILAERCFGYDNKHHSRLPSPTSAAGVSAAHMRAEVIAAQNVNNARALERGLLLVLVIPMGIKFVIYCALYWTLPRDRKVEPVLPEEDSDSEAGSDEEAPPSKLPSRAGTPGGSLRSGAAFAGDAARGAHQVIELKSVLAGAGPGAGFAAADAGSLADGGCSEPSSGELESIALVGGGPSSTPGADPRPSPRRRSVTVERGSSLGSSLELAVAGAFRAAAPLRPGLGLGSASTWHVSGATSSAASSRQASLEPRRSNPHAG